MRPTKAAIKSIEESQEKKVIMEIEVPTDVVEQEINKVYKKIVHQIAVPGFRKGKAPRYIIEKRVGPDFFYEEVQKDLINDAFMEALLTTDIKPISSEILETSVSKGEPLIFKVQIEKEPVLDIDNYKNVKVEAEKFVVEEENIEAGMKELQNRYSKMVLIKDRPAEMGDLALLDFYATDEDGERVEKIGEEKNFRVEIGSGQTIKGFEDGVIGMELNTEKGVECTFPEDYNEESLQGKKVTFHLKLKELKAKVLPELNDDFAKELGEHETLDELRNQIKENLEKTNDERQKQVITGKILDKLIEDNADMEVPEEMIDSSLEKIKRNLEYELQMYRFNLEGLLKQQGKTMEDFKNESRPRALKMAQSDIILSSIAAKEEILATEEEIEKKMQEWADNYGSTLEKFKKMVEKEGTIRTIKDEIVIDKVKDLLCENADVTYVEPKTEEENTEEEKGSEE